MASFAGYFGKAFRIQKQRWMSMANERPLTYPIALAGIGALILAVFLLCTFWLCGLVKDASWCLWWPHLSVSQIVHFIQSAGFWGVGASIGLMILHSFIPFPAELVAIVNGMVYGIFWGIVITWVGAMLGAFLAFGLSRKLGRPFVQKMLSKKKIALVDEWVTRQGAGPLFISRFIPIIAFNLINYVAGLTQISWGTFGWTTGVGILPMTVLMVVMGDGVALLPWWLWPLFLLAGVLLWLVLHRLIRHWTIAHTGE